MTNLGPRDRGEAYRGKRDKDPSSMNSSSASSPPYASGSSTSPATVAAIDVSNRRKDPETLIVDTDWDAETLGMIQKIRTSLSEATRVEASSEDLPSTQGRITTPCGHGLYTPDRQCWQVRFRPFGVQTVDGGVLAAGVAEGHPSPTGRLPTVWVARLWREGPTADGSSSAPDNLVRYILQCAELRNMLQQIQSQISERRTVSPSLEVSCRTSGKTLYFGPLLTRLTDCDTAASNTMKLDCLKDYIDMALCCASPGLCSWSQQKEWRLELGSTWEMLPDTDAPNDRGAVRLVKECLEQGQSSRGDRVKYKDGEEKKEDVTVTRPSVRRLIRSTRASSDVVRPGQPQSESSPVAQSDLTDKTVDTKSQDAPIGSSRPQRKILKVDRFDPTPMTISEVSSLLDAQETVSSGFSCPECGNRCPYVGTECSACHTKCQYVPGVGVRVEADGEDTAGDSTMANGERQSVSTRICRSGASTVNKKQASREQPASILDPLRRRLRSGTQDVSTSLSSKKPIATELASKLDQKKHYRDIEVGECEACLRPFGLCFLERHRSELHRLRSGEHGCPHCSYISHSAEERLKHMKDSHPVLPMRGSLCENVKRHVYLCPVCNGWFSWSGLVRHIQKTHGTNVEKVRDKIHCMCPFCPWSDTKTKQFRFRSDEELRRHVSSQHRGCMLLDDVTKIQLASKRAEDHSQGRKQIVKSVLKPPDRVPAAKRGSAPVLPAAPAASSLDGWKRLDHKELVGDYMYGNFAPVAFGSTLASAVAAANRELQALKEDYNSASIDEEYLKETKLGYNKELRTRGQKGDAERIEKVRHREEVERSILHHEYENRGKKKSSSDIEFEAFLERPVRFVPKRTKIRHSACDAGSDCELCVPIDEDGIADNEKVQDRIIEAPFCEARTVTDFWEEEEDNFPEESRRKRRRLGRDQRKVNRSVMMLNEIQQSMLFVRDYNSGF